MALLKDKIKYWLMASRPRTLPAGISPVIIGAFYAYKIIGIKYWYFSILALFSSFFLQIGTNLANDYYDALHGIDNDNRLGPVRVTQKGLIPPKQVKIAFLLCFVIAVIIGIPLIFRGGLYIIIIGILSIVFAYLYTGGPYPLSYIGMGEILAFIFFGQVATCGTYYLNTLTISLNVIVFASGPGFISALIMSINNLRDIKNDSQSGKKTIAVFLGEQKARYFSFSLFLLSLLIPILSAAIEQKLFLILSSFSAILFRKNWIDIVTKPIDSSFNNILADTGKFLFIYSILFSIGLIL